MKQVVIVTGANGGLGLEIVNTLLAETTYDILGVIFGESETEDHLSSPRLNTCYQDITAADSGAKMLNHLRGTVGEFTIKALVNNAGINRDALFAKMTPEQWQDVLATNLTALYNVTRPILLQMIEDGDRQLTRHIVSIASVIGLSGGIGQTNYAAAKAGIIGFTKSLALESARQNILVNAIAPGFINTPMTAGIPEKVKEKLYQRIPLGRFGEPEDIARLVLYILSTSYATGQVFSVNGGLYV